MKNVVPSKGRLAFAPVRDRPSHCMSQDRQGFPRAGLFLPPGQRLLTGGMLPQASDGGFAERPLELGLTDVGP
jgi:hypothetical protein